MKNNMKNIYDFNFFVSAIFLAVMASAQLVDADTCDHAELLRCAQPLKALTDTELGLVARKEELEQLCPTMNNGLRCIDGYTRRCMTSDKREEFNRLYSGTSQVIQDLCKEGPYQEEFLRHAPCMRLVKNEYDDCASHYTEMLSGVNSNNLSQHGADTTAQMKTVCCSFQDYLTCSENIVMKQCGEATANFTSGFLNRMSSSLITNRCRQYLPNCMDAISGAYNSSAVRISNWLLLLLVNCLIMLANAYLVPQAVDTHYA